MIYCNHCNGSGEGMHDRTRCQVCHGKGVLPSEEETEAAEVARCDAADARRKERMEEPS